jgi:Arc/MetJ-type ribon-helix-helix transcriptional regulator
MAYTLTDEQEARLEHHVRLGTYPSKEAALEEAFRRFKKMLDKEAEQSRPIGSGSTEK